MSFAWSNNEAMTHDTIRTLDCGGSRFGVITYSVACSLDCKNTPPLAAKPLHRHFARNEAGEEFGLSTSIEAVENRPCRPPAK